MPQRRITHDPCLICGSTKATERVAARLAPVEAGGKVTFSVLDRCEDRAACRARCAASGEPWIVIDPEDRARALAAAGS